jgi:hypothetical protein
VLGYYSADGWANLEDLWGTSVEQIKLPWGRFIKL